MERLTHTELDQFISPEVIQHQKIAYATIAGIAVVVLVVNYVRSFYALYHLYFLSKNGFGRRWVMKIQRGNVFKINEAEVLENSQATGMDPRVVRDVEKSV